jgi:hypothetical protein
MTNWDTKVVGREDKEPVIQPIGAEPPELANIQQRWNPNIPYAPVPDVVFSPRDEVLYRAFLKAIKNGWQGWRLFLTDTVTLNLEAEGLLKQMIKYQKPIEPIIFNKDFNYFLWFENTKGNWRYHIQQMAISEDVIKYIKENIEDDNI